MIRHAGDGPKTLACRHNDHGGTANILDLPAHTSGATAEASKEGCNTEDSNCIAIPFPQKMENGVELGSKPFEDVNLCFWADGW